MALARCTAHQHFRVAAKRARSTCGAPVLDRRTLALLRLARPTCISPARANRRNLSARTPSGVLCLARSRCAMDHDDASRVRGNRANVEVALDRVANLAEPGAQSASYEDESLIHGNSTATSPDLTRAVGDSQAMVSGPDTPAARENSDGHRNSPRKMPRVASSPCVRAPCCWSLRVTPARRCPAQARLHPRSWWAGASPCLLECAQTMQQNAPLAARGPQ